MAGGSSHGYTLIELTCVAALIVTVSAVTIPNLVGGLDDARARGATRYLAGRLYQARMQAVMRSKDVAFRFVSTGAGYTYAMYVDGNRNGVLSRDVQQGIDEALEPPQRLVDQFGGADFGTLPGLPPVDSGSTAPGSDPIRLGSSDILTFTPGGTSSSGSLYIRRNSAQYVIRIFGDTGKVRVLRFNVQTGRWDSL